MTTRRDARISTAHGRSGLMAMVVIMVMAVMLTAGRAHAGATGACCTADGTCIELARALCDVLGGTYRGDGTTCPATPPCVAYGGCCFNDASCATLEEAACAKAGGQYLGDGSGCGAGVCPFRGACCFDDGTCADGATFESCADGGGLYRGFGTTCAQIVCGGACSLADGTCLENLSRDDCAAAGAPIGGYLGDATTCADVFGPRAMHEVVVAFSQNDERTLALPAFDELGGARTLVGVTFSIDAAVHARVVLRNEGADPLPTDLEASETVVVTAPPFDPDPIVVVDVPLQVFLCDPPELPSGESCDYGGPLSFPGADTQTWSAPGDDLAPFLGPGTNDVHVTGEGTFRYLGTNFSLVQSPHRVEAHVRVVYDYVVRGACCADDGACDDIFVIDCETTGGVFLGAGTSCATDGCAAACCLPEGTCEELDADTCIARGGEYAGFGDSCLDTACAQACCLGSGDCSFLTETECLQGGASAQGYGTSCQNDYECPEACCLPSGTCLNIGAMLCEVSGGTARGPGSLCKTIVCLVPSGACCFADLSCDEISPFECDQAGGEYVGLPCSFVECTPLCPADLDNDGFVGIQDMLTVLVAWGECGLCVVCPADLDRDCVVDFDDLLVILLAWGACPS